MINQLSNQSDKLRRRNFAVSDDSCVLSNDIGDNFINTILAKSASSKRRQLRLQVDFVVIKLLGRGAVVDILDNDARRLVP